MSRNWLIGVGVGLLATAALVTVGVTAYELGERETEQIVVTGTESVGGRIIVDNDGWRHGPGPGFLILPLVIVGAIFLLSSRRRHGWCGPGYRRGPWDDQRYRDERDRDERYRSERDDWERRPDRPVEAPAAPSGPATPPESGS
jgi:hypothetical protein